MIKLFCILSLVILGGLTPNSITYCPRCDQDTLEPVGEPEIAYYICELKSEELFKYTCTNCVNPPHSEYDLVIFEHIAHEIARTVEETCLSCGQATKIKVVTCEGDKQVTSYEVPSQKCCPTFSFSFASSSSYPYPTQYYYWIENMP